MPVHLWNALPKTYLCDARNLPETVHSLTGSLLASLMMVGDRKPETFSCRLCGGQGEQITNERMVEWSYHRCQGNFSGIGTSWHSVIQENSTSQKAAH
jgi:hypothetical protein